jgi:small ligand-binding sensory domain FIST
MAKRLQHHFTVSHGQAPHWGAAAKACLDGLGPYRGKGANLGFLYVTEAFADDLSSILTFLRETTPIQTWVGGVVPALCAQSAEVRKAGAIGIMVGALPEDSFRPFVATDIPKTLTETEHAAIVHGDPRHPLVPTLCLNLRRTTFQSVGGLMSSMGPEHQVAGTIVAGGGSGLLLGNGVELIVGLTQGCSPIGPTHIVTDAIHNVLMELDGVPPLDLLKSEAGDLIARDLRRASGYIHVGVMEGDTYSVRSLVGIDQTHGYLAVTGEIREGERIMFVRRDANTAQQDLSEMLERVRGDLDGRPALGALYYSCIARGVHMFGEEGAELTQIRTALDNVPLLGFFANGEIANGQIYAYTGILAVLVSS